MFHWSLLLSLLLPGSSDEQASDFDPTPIVEQTRDQIFQHGPWTLQRHVRLDPFGKAPSLYDNREECLSVFHAGRPVWRSERTNRVSFSTPLFRDADAPRFEVVKNTVRNWFGRDPDLRAVDYTGGQDLTLFLTYWSGGNVGSEHELVRLRVDDEGLGQVESLWAGWNGKLRDVDRDGVPEIIHTDACHRYVPYLPHKGVQAVVILAWSPEGGGYRLANSRLFLTHLRRTEREARGWDREEWQGDRSWRLKIRMRAIELADDSVRDESRETAVFMLGSYLSEFLWAGEVEAARSLFQETELSDFQLQYQPESARSREAWQREFLQGFRRSRYWPELAELHPALAKLESLD